MARLSAKSPMFFQLFFIVTQMTKNFNAFYIFYFLFFLMQNQLQNTRKNYLKSLDNPSEKRYNMYQMIHFVQGGV